MPDVRTKTLSLPRLTNAQSSLESAALLLMQETGELAGAISALHELLKKSGSRQPDLPWLSKDEMNETAKRHGARAVADELLEVAQTAVTMMFVLEEDFKVDIEEALADHISRLIEKGYIKLQSN